ncbi:MAG: CRISPR-associated helicase Cas3' [Gammaproteobacteria bacterium]|nr:CRISPR-associated helicase Cas3' [Gammaproteobacteria bacterium]
MGHLAFWGKARPHELSPRSHPLAWHSLDVAAVADVLFRARRGPAQGVTRLLGWPREEANRILCYLLALHDVGKFAKRFQAKAPECFPQAFNEDPAGVVTSYDHGSGGLAFFDAHESMFLGGIRSDAMAWRLMVSAAFGHHGEPPRASPGAMADLRVDFGRAGLSAARGFVEQIRDFFHVSPLPRLDEGRAARVSFTLAGLAVLADWIGSNQEWFPYQEPKGDIPTYWASARDRAAVAVARSGVLPASIKTQLAYRQLLPGKSKLRVSPMQEWAESVKLPDGPSMFLIEDETGSGKTEAAIMLAHRLMKAGSASGVYVALPTMATANAMFERLASRYRLLFEPAPEPSLALAHGARDMHDGFRAAKLAGGRPEPSYSPSAGGDASEVTASAACAEWVADDRRRAFLADVGAGTVDQALLSILPSRHQSLRLLGLSQRVVVLDEIHAYDAYMQQEIERLLEFQAGLGGSAILLSATLPLNTRRRLTDAFARGLAAPTDDQEAPMAYPLATVCASAHRSAHAVPGRPSRARTLPVRFIRSADAAIQEVANAADQGKAVLYVRNTVDDALDAHAKLAELKLPVAPSVFHARFALADRFAIEQRVLASFGPASTSAMRGGRVLVATQVVEQSLDLDFDVLVTDLAPIDLLIQRAGRLWRHGRAGREGEPELVVVGPASDQRVDEKWFSRLFPRAAYVYRDHAKLWLTARTLERAGVIDSPRGLRALIESVYGDDAEAELPDALLRFHYDAEGRSGAERGVANMNVLNLASGYWRDGGAWDSDARTPTRLNDDPQRTLRLARVENGEIVPFAATSGSEEAWRAWRLSEVHAPERRVGGEFVDHEHREAVEAARQAWTRFDRHTILVVLQQAGDRQAYEGLVQDASSPPRVVTLGYDSESGLTWR